MTWDDKEWWVDGKLMMTNNDLMMKDDGANDKGDGILYLKNKLKIGQQKKNKKGHCVWTKKIFIYLFVYSNDKQAMGDDGGRGVKLFRGDGGCWETLGFRRQGMKMNIEKDNGNTKRDNVCLGKDDQSLRMN